MPCASRNPFLETHHDHHVTSSSPPQRPSSASPPRAARSLAAKESTGAYIDDSAITTSVKARFVDSASVDASAISVETLKGTVMLSGFAKTANEKATAESIAMEVPGVVAVKNVISVRP